MSESLLGRVAVVMWEPQDHVNIAATVSAQAQGQAQVIAVRPPAAHAAA